MKSHNLPGAFEWTSKYAAVYEMARSLEERDMHRLEHQIGQYGRKQFMVETLFSLK